MAFNAHGGERGRQDRQRDLEKSEYEQAGKLFDGEGLGLVPDPTLWMPGIHAYVKCFLTLIGMNP